MRRALLIAAWATALAAPGASHATIIGINPDPIVAGPLQADSVAIVAGIPAGGSVLEGSIGPDDLTLVLLPTFLPSDLEVNPIRIGSDAILLPHPTGAGSIPGPGRDVVAVLRSFARIDPAVVLAFDFEPGVHPAGVEGDLIFVSFPSLNDGDRLRLTINAREPGSHPLSGLHIRWLRLVPEPSTALAAVAASLALGIRRGVIG